MSEHDRIFMKNFTLIIVSLMVFTLVVAVLGYNMNKRATRPDNPDKLAQLEERIAPVGQVYAGEAGAAAQAAAAAAPVVAVAFDGSLDGEMIYNSVCGACHNVGVAGAPKLEQADWDVRAAQGMEVMVNHAIDGFQGEAGVMPARGGRMDLSDEQVRITVQWMLDNLQ